MMRIMPILPFLLLTQVFTATAGPDAAQYLVPTPRECQMRGEILFEPKPCRYVNPSQISPGLLRWLTTGITEVLGWKTATKKQRDCIEFRLEPLPGTRSYPTEYYELEIQPNRIILRAADPDGFCRGVGRFRGMIATPLIKNQPGGSGHIFPDMTIRDAPSEKLPVRAFMLHISGASGNLPDLKQWREHFRRHIDAAAMLGYNAMFINFGGRMELKSHPELVIRNFRSHSQEEIRRIIAYGRGLGMKVWPMTSAIGHYFGGYQIFPIIQKGVKNVDGKPATARAMNLAHPDFYKVFFECMEEVCKVFDKPEYLCIRTDEFYNELELLKKATGKSFPQFYSEFLNRCIRHFAPRGTKIMVCQDMWVPARTLLEESNGDKDAAELLKLVDKDIAICYWRYDFSRFTWLKKFHDHGFRDLWVMPWYKPEPTRLLIGEGVKYGAKVFAGIWSEPGQNNGLPAIAEYAWNPKAAPCQIPRLDQASDYLFYSRGTKIPARQPTVLKPQGGVPASLPDTVRQLKNDSGIPSDFSSAVKFPGKPDWIRLDSVPPLLELARNGQLQKITFGVKGCPMRIRFRTYGINRARGWKEIIFYTPEFGKSTKTNIYGYEFSLSGRKVKKVDLRFSAPESLPNSGNFPIEKEVLTISRHGLNFYDDPRPFYRQSNNLADRIRPGTELEFYQDVKGEPATGKISFPLPESRDRIVLYLQAGGPIAWNTRAAVVVLKTRSGKQAKHPVPGFHWYVSGYNHRMGRHIYLPWIDELNRNQLFPVVAVDYPGKLNGEPVVSVTILPTGDSADMDLTVLGATAYNTAE